MKEDDSRAAVPVGKPMISSRLPKAFSQPKHLTHKKIQESHQDLSAANEYKNVKKLLSPLKQSTSKNSAFNKALNKLAYLPKILASTPSNNPQIDMLVQSIVRLDEMITISVLRSSYRSGTVKKSLHAPSLRLYASKEVPVSTFSIRQKLIETIKSWQSIQKAARYLVEVNSSFWNSPEGCVTIVMEYMAGDSLGRLCEAVGAMPERLLKSITRRILTGLSYYHKKIGAHGGVDLNHIMFTRLGKAKLGLGLTTRLNLKEDNSSRKIANASDDVFDFGVTLIAASLGGSDWISDIMAVTGECCLFHTALGNSEIPYLPRFSREFGAFLCAATRYEEESRAGINDLLMHEWLKSEEAVGVEVGIKDLLGMTVSIPGRDAHANVEKQIEMIAESLKMVNGNGESKQGNNDNMKELAFEFGVSPEILLDKFKGIIKFD